jgi:hypothetical protein
MCAKWVKDSENSVNVLAKQLETHKIYDTSGKFEGWQGFEYDDYPTAIESYLIFDNQIPQYERSGILDRAINSSAKAGKLVAKEILKYVSIEENQYLNKPKTTFILATSISVRYFDELKKTSRKNKSIKFSRSLPKRFDRKKAIEEWKLLRFGELPQSYTSIQISVSARGEWEAFDAAIDELDLLRGIWNLRLNGEVLFSFSRTGAEPINKIKLGALHTLHFPNGKPATDGIFWFEPDYIERSADISREWENISQLEQKVRKRLLNHLYRTDIEDAIRRYARALDYRDYHISFLELWILLEKLTATTNAQYEKMVKRVAFLHEDVDLHKQLMQHLRLYRNSNVHTGERSSRISKHVYQLKRYVELLLRFNLVNTFKFTSLEEAASFLDLPTDTNLLKERVKLLNKGIKFRP